MGTTAGIDVCMCVCGFVCVCVSACLCVCVPVWPPMGPTWGLMGPAWGQPGATWGQPSASRWPRRPDLGLLWPYGASLGPLHGATHGASLGPPAACWGGLAFYVCY
jgi:hypothetical protein